MKILMVNDYAESFGGTEVYMYVLKNALEKQGHTVTVFTSTANREDLYRVTNKPNLRDFATRVFNIPACLRFKRTIDDFKPDVVHIHNYYSHVSPSILLWCKHIRTIVTIHDQRIKGAVTNQSSRTGRECKHQICIGCTNCVGWKGALFERIKHIVHKPLLKNVDLFIAPSKFMYNQLNIFPELQPMIQLYNGFPLLKPKPLPHNKRILYAGRLVKDKGVHILIQAMPLIIQKAPDATLHIVGAGEYEHELKKLTRELGIQKYIQFHGKIPHSKVQEEIYKSDIVCIPSLYNDNLPTIGIEALGAGRIVLVSDRGGLPELVDDGVTGKLFKQASFNGLERAITQLFDEQMVMNRMSVAARKKRAQFDIGQHLKIVEEMYGGKR